MITDAKVAVIGGGVAGCSLLYHLTRLGWSDVILLEQHELTSGSTWHSAGLCTQFNQSYNVMGLLRASVELYEPLEAETGQAVDYHRCGSVRIATTETVCTSSSTSRGIAESRRCPVRDRLARARVRALPAHGSRRRRRCRVPADRRPRRSQRADERTCQGRLGTRARASFATRRVTAIECRDGVWHVHVEGRGRLDDSGRDRRQRRRDSGPARSRGLAGASCRSSRCSTTTSSRSRSLP